MMERTIADRFVVERLVGSGGMGEVFRAKDKLTGGPVAIKVLYESMLGRSRAADAARFEREAQLLATITHPRIVRYIAHGTVEGGRPWLAMEWLEGEDLGERLDRSGLRLHDAVTVTRCVAEALSALHDAHIVHRDIKPSNIFLPNGNFDQAKVLDLGVARLIRTSRPSTRSGIMVGTPGYMAPEQARGSKDLDARVDVFSLGCVLWECLAGRPAFAGENIAALLAKILMETPPLLSDVGIDVPPLLQDLVRRMLVKPASGRPANGRAVLVALEQFTNLDAPAQRASVPHQRVLTAGERRLVCVVMAAHGAVEEPVVIDDASPNMIETMAAFDPRSVAATFGGELETLADGSIVVSLIGKGGASDQAAYAARCALQLRSHLIDAHVVLATGLATMDGPSAVGEVIERAAALLATAKARQPHAGDTMLAPRPILLDETTAGLLDMRFDVGGDDRGLFIRGLRERESAEARTLLGKPTPFVGRDRELGALTAIFDECNDEGVARAALVTGFPGSGKSRLVTEFLAWLKPQDSNSRRIETWIARGDAMSEGSSFALVARFLRRSAGITGSEPLIVRQQKLRARVARNVAEPDVARVTEFLGETASIPFSDVQSVQLRAARQDPILMGDQMRRAFCDLVVAEGTAGTLVLVIEDLHWGDLPSVNLIDAALRTAHDHRFMVLAVARGEVHDAFPQLWAQRSLQEIRLGPLVRRAGEKLVRDVLGDALPAADVARLLDRAAGNAFYLEELIRAYVEQGSPRPKTSEVDLRKSLPPEPIAGRLPTAHGAVETPSWALPTTVLAMVEARLQRLDPMARRVLRAASIFGERFWRGGVLALTGGQYKGSELDAWLDDLSRREIVQRRDVSRFAHDHEYVFRHAIVRDAAYQMLTPEDLILGHRLAGTWLEEAGEEEPMRLGEHFERGGAKERAATFYGRAALQSLEGNDFVVAKVRATRAIEAGAVGAALGSLHLLLAEASRWSGEHEAAREHAIVALRELTAGSDEAYVAAAESVEAAITLGHVEEASTTAAAVLAFAALPETPAITTPRVVATTRIAIALGVVGLYTPAIGLLAPFEGDLIGADDTARAFLLAANVARSSWEGDSEATALRAQEAAACFDVLGDQRNAARQRLAAGWALTEIGAYIAAEMILASARDDAERLGLLAVANDAKLCLSFVLARTNRFEPARDVAQEVIEGFAAQRDRVGEGRARAYLAGVHYFGGDSVRAEEEELRALPLLEHSPPHRAALLGFITLTRVALGAPGELTYEAGAEAMRLLEQVGGVAEGEALIRLAWAEGLAAKGDMDGARVAIAAARGRLLARAAKMKSAEYKRSFLGVVREHVRTLARAGEWLT